MKVTVNGELRENDMESMDKAVIRALCAVLTAVVCVLSFAVYVLYGKSVKTDTRIAELENEVTAKNKELSEKIEHESLVYEQLFRAYTLGVQGDW